MSTYVPVGDVEPGSFVTIGPIEQELARREKTANDKWGFEDDDAR